MVHIRMSNFSAITRVPRWKLWLIGSGLLALTGAIAIMSLALAVVIAPVAALILAYRSFRTRQTPDDLTSSGPPGVIDADYVIIQPGEGERAPPPGITARRP